MSRLHQAAKYLAAEVSARWDEFRQANHPGGEMLLMGLLSQRLARQKGDRVALTDAGRRMAGEA